MDSSYRSVVTRLIIALSLAGGLMALSGCGYFGQQAEMPVESMKEPGYDAAPPPSEPSLEGRSAEMADESEAAPAGDAGGVATAEAAPADRKVIKTAQVDLEVREIEAAQKQILDLVDRRNGFVSSMNVNNYDTGRQANIVARVPSDYFGEIYEAVKALGKVTRDQLGGQDVTEEYMDLERRIVNLQAQEARVREMFEDARTIEDLLQIEQRLTEVRTQIEQHQGRLRYLKDQVGFSTLTISLYEPGQAPIEAPDGWELGYHLRGAWLALVRAFRGVVYAIIWIVVTGSVIWVPLLIVILLLRRWAIRRRAERARAQEPPADQS